MSIIVKKIHWPSLLLSLVLCSLNVALANAEDLEEAGPPIVVGEPLPIPETDSSNRPIVGFRAASSSFLPGKLVKTDEGLDAGLVFLSEQVVIDAWLSDQNFAELIKAKKIPTDSISAIRANGVEVDPDFRTIG